jgi:hypothetical protein
MARIVKMTMPGLYMMDRGLLLTLRVYNHMLSPQVVNLGKLSTTQNESLVK